VRRLLKARLERQVKCRPGTDKPLPEKNQPALEDGNGRHGASYINTGADVQPVYRGRKLFILRRLQREHIAIKVDAADLDTRDFLLGPNRPNDFLKGELSVLD